MKIYTGCSGFHYKHWKEKFYPAGLPQKEWLPYYAEHFNTVEINNTFYGLPDEKKLRNWHEQTPGDFRFTLKGSRYISHTKKLVNDDRLRSALKTFYAAIEPLAGKTGCVLWQLPGNLHRNDEKLDGFCSLLPAAYSNVIEFRHSSWFTEPVLELLSRHKVSFCVISAPDDLPEMVEVTTDTAYVRFHGKKEWYRYHYSDNELGEWSRRVNSLGARRAWLYFNNDTEAWAVENAQTLKEMFT